MKKVLVYILAGLVCFILFTLLFATGIGVFFLVIYWNAVIIPVWKEIIKLAQDKVEKNDNNEELQEKTGIKQDTKTENETQNKKSNIMWLILLGFIVLCGIGIVVLEWLPIF